MTLYAAGQPVILHQGIILTHNKYIVDFILKNSWKYFSWVDLQRKQVDIIAPQFWL